MQAPHNGDADYRCPNDYQHPQNDYNDLEQSYIDGSSLT